ncbi:hypothetical protein Tco_1503089 [Tanacetum coccineum]
MSESDKEEEEEQDVDPLIKLAKAAAASDAHVDVSPGADIPPSPPLPTGMSAGVSSGVSTGTPAGTSNKGKSPIMEVDPPVKRRTFRQIAEDRLGEEAAKKLFEEEHADLERQRAEMQRKRQQDVLDSAKYYTDADWTDIMGQVHANQGLTSRSFSPMSMIYNLLKEWRTLKRAGEDLEHDVSKKPKPTEVPMSSQPDVPQQQATNVPPVDPQQPSESSSQPNVTMSSGPEKKGHTYGTRRKSFRTRKKSSTTLDLDADDRSFIRVLSDDDSDDDDDPVIVWSAFATWEVVPTPLGDINALYMLDRWVISSFISQLMKKMLKHKLEIEINGVGNDMTYAEQLIQFIKHQIAASIPSA